MPAPILAAIGAGARAVGQAAARGTAVAARTGARVGGKVAAKGTKAAAKGGTKAAQQGGRAAARAGTKTAQHGGRAAARGGAATARRAGHTTGRAAQGLKDAGHTRAQQLLTNARSRQHPTGRAAHGLNPRTRALNRQHPTGRARRAFDTARGAGQSSGRLANTFRSARTGDAQAPKTVGQRVKSFRKGWRRARQLRHAWKNRDRLPGHKQRQKLKKLRQRVRRLLLASVVLQVLLLLSPIIFMYFMLAGSPDPRMFQQAANPAITVNGSIPAALLAEVSARTGIPTCAGVGSPPPLAGGDAAAAGACVPALESYSSAAAARGVDWTILAGIGQEECSHGRSRLPGCSRPGTTNGSGARGPMQFLGSTWRFDAGTFDPDVSGPAIPDGQEGRGYATDGNGNGNADPWEWADATHAAARYLLASGLDRDVERAIFAYNHSQEYVNDVVSNAERYRSQVSGLDLSGGARVGDYALPLDPHWYQDNPHWFTKPHHDYPAADIPVPTGTPVYAAASGTVASAPTGGSCGVGVKVRGDDGVEYIYCHGSDGGQIVRTGDRVTAGQVIMHSASTGNSTGPHLHFGIRVDGQNRCPQDFLVALATGRTANPRTLPASGCSY
jgi:murein DD-endopeptidase MepM/ murein hydrolase activator NlpD